VAIHRNSAATPLHLSLVPKLPFGAGVLHCGEVATAHGRALQDKRKKVGEKQWPGRTKQQAREGGAWKLTRDYPWLL